MSGSFHLEILPPPRESKRRSSAKISPISESSEFKGLAIRWKTCLTVSDPSCAWTDDEGSFF